MSERTPENVNPGDDPVNAANPDPADGNVTGLEPGGGVPPGETPPSEASTTWQQGRSEDKAPSKAVPTLVIGVVGLIVILVLIFIIGNIVGIFQMF
ncbi:DUF6480 family protein [Arthrobacter sp. RIT-PI-e]|uniref:DUF6480 family protein n=1 Tax=Arthrobacter sp. RIT-PI-e TaxID=1681197 RepID=UPI000AAF9701|nr:DUF6480 family protein [Arthrobacter sp. RIT-PI-e]